MRNLKITACLLFILTFMTVTGCSLFKSPTEPEATASQNDSILLRSSGGGTDHTYYDSETFDLSHDNGLSKLMLGQASKFTIQHGSIIPTDTTNPAVRG